MRHGLSQSQCEAECVVQIIAGSDTTGTTIRTALLFILSSPRIYNRFMEEARSAINSGLVSPSVPITHGQGTKLPYLRVPPPLPSPKSPPRKSSLTATTTSGHHLRSPPLSAPGPVRALQDGPSRRRHNRWRLSPRRHRGGTQPDRADAVGGGVRVRRR